MKMTGARILIEELVNQNVKTVFGYPGGAVLNIYDELYKSSDRIEHIIFAHEQGAAHAADGYARVTGDVGVVIATSGPGATNLVTGIATAYLDSVPMVAITGNVSTDLLGRDSFQEVDIVGITGPVVKHNFIVKDVSELEEILKEAFLIAKSGRKGPVLVDIPKDVQTGICEYSGNKPFENEDVNDIDDDEISKAIKLINESERPFIYCGGGAIAAGVSDEIMELSKKVSSPIGSSLMGISAIPNSYNMYLGMTGMHGRYAASVVKSKADAIIAIGVRFSDRSTGNKKAYVEGTKIIHIDIDPAEIDKNIIADVVLCGNIKGALQKIINGVSERKNTDWVEDVERVKKIEETLVDNSDRFSPRNIITTVNKFSSVDTVVATDVGQHQMWVMQNYSFEKPRTLLSSGGLGTMGYGFGASIGGCVANGRKRTVLFTGDGSFGMNLNELATAVSQNLPITIVILDNGVLGMVRQWQRAFYEERYSQTTLDRKTNFKLLAEAFGAKGYEVFDIGEFKEVLKEIENYEGTVVVDCHIDMDEKVLPMIPPGGSIEDLMVN